jgi:hypothetical protein
MYIGKGCVYFRLRGCRLPYSFETSQSCQNCPRKLSQNKVTFCKDNLSILPVLTNRLKKLCIFDWCVGPGQRGLKTEQESFSPHWLSGKDNEAVPSLQLSEQGVLQRHRKRGWGFVVYKRASGRDGYVRGQERNTPFAPQSRSYRLQPYSKGRGHCRPTPSSIWRARPSPP